MAAVTEGGRILWGVSVLLITVSFLALDPGNLLTLAASLTGVMSLIFCAKGAREGVSYLPVAVCFLLFLVNDLYGFINWSRMRRMREKYRGT